jgi:hypothetical protein
MIDPSVVGYQTDMELKLTKKRPETSGKLEDAGNQLGLSSHARRKS